MLAQHDTVLNAEHRLLTSVILQLAVGCLSRSQEPPTPLPHPVVPV